MNPTEYIQRYYDVEHSGFNGCQLVHSTTIPKLYYWYIGGECYSGKSLLNNPILDDLMHYALLGGGGFSSFGQGIPIDLPLYIPIDRIISC